MLAHAAPAANTEETVVNALRDILCATRGALAVRRNVDGLLPAAAREPGAGRNLLGFNDGTSNPDPRDDGLISKLVLTAGGGTFGVIRNRPQPRPAVRTRAGAIGGRAARRLRFCSDARQTPRTARSCRLIPMTVLDHPNVCIVEDLDACRLDETGRLTPAFIAVRTWRAREAARQAARPKSNATAPEMPTRAATHTSAYGVRAGNTRT